MPYRTCLIVLPPEDPSMSHAMCLPAPEDPVGPVASSPQPICPCCMHNHHSPHMLPHALPASSSTSSGTVRGTSSETLHLRPSEAHLPKHILQVYYFIRDCPRHIFRDTSSEAI